MRAFSFYFYKFYFLLKMKMTKCFFEIDRQKKIVLEAVFGEADKGWSVLESMTDDQYETL